MSTICLKCGKENPEESKSKFCVDCGSVVNGTPPNNHSPNYSTPSLNYNPNQRPMQWKSEGTTLILTVLGIIGLVGIGHIYLGNITRGIVLLIVGIVLAIITLVTFGIGFIILIPFAIWVIYDARKQCKHYNDHLEQTGKHPWQD